jgi:polar amino acid transport system permease protein
MMLATSVVSQISAPDLFHVASIIQSRTFRDFEIYAVTAGVYLALALAFKLLFAAIEHFAFSRR